MRIAFIVGGYLTLGLALVSAGQGTSQVTRPSLALDSMSGQDSFVFYCAPCHGRGGRGDGPVAAALTTPPPDLGTLAQRTGGAFPRATVTSFITGTGRTPAAHGPGDMPVWGPIFRSLDPSGTRAKVRIDNLVAFIESIQVK